MSCKPRQEEAEPLLPMKFWRLFYDFQNKLIGSAEELQSVQVLLYGSPRIQELSVKIQGE